MRKMQEDLMADERTGMSSARACRLQQRRARIKEEEELQRERAMVLQEMEEQAEKDRLAAEQVESLKLEREMQVKKRLSCSAKSTNSKMPMRVRQKCCSSRSTLLGYGATWRRRRR